MINEFDIQIILDEVIERFLKPHFRKLGMNASGDWLENVHAEKNKIMGMDYTEYLVHGREAGSYAPIAPLERWARNKFGADPREARRIAFAVSNKLKNVGSNYFQQGGTDLLEVLQSDEVVDFIQSEIKSLIVSNIKNAFVR
jgi:hypothetical protein